MKMKNNTQKATITLLTLNEDNAQFIYNMINSHTPVIDVVSDLRALDDDQEKGLLWENFDESLSTVFPNGYPYYSVFDVVVNKQHFDQYRDINFLNQVMDGVKNTGNADELNTLRFIYYCGAGALTGTVLNLSVRNEFLQTVLEPEVKIEPFDRIARNLRPVLRESNHTLVEQLKEIDALEKFVRKVDRLGKKVNQTYQSIGEFFNDKDIQESVDFYLKK